MVDACLSLQGPVAVSCGDDNESKGSMNEGELLYS